VALVYVNNGEVVALSLLVNKVTTTENLILGLFTNNYTPIETTVLGDLTEATGSGYAAKTLTGASWTVTGGAPTTASYAAQQFTFSGALGNVYGYFFKRASSGDLIAAEVFSGAPFNVASTNHSITITPVLSAD
jgi:hypothetical protein